MIASFRRVFKDTFVYGIGDVIIRGSAFFTIPFYTRFLSTTEYGRWGFMLAAMELFAGILALGGDSAYARYFFEAKDVDAKQLVTSTWFLFLTGWSAIIVLAVVPFSGLLSQWSFDTRSFNVAFAIALITVPATFLSSMLGQALRNEFRAATYTIVNVVGTALIVGCSIAGALIATDPLEGILLGGLIAIVLVLPVRLVLVRHLLRRQFSTQLLRKLLAYGLPLVPASLAWWVFSLSDRIVLAKLSTLREVGLYTLAVSVTGVIAVFVSAFGLAWSPHAFEIYEQRRDIASAFFGRIATFIVVGFAVLSVLLTTFGRELLELLTTPEFYGAAAALGPLALGFVAFASTQITASGISLKKKTYWFIVISWIAACVNLVLNFIFVPRWGMLASAWATFVSYLVLTVGYLIVSQRLWPVAYERRRLAVVSVLTFAFVVCVPLLPRVSLAPSLFIKSLYVLTFGVLLVVLRVIDQDELRSLGSLVLRRPAPRPGAA